MKILNKNTEQNHIIVTMQCDRWEQSIAHRPVGSGVGGTSVGRRSRLQKSSLLQHWMTNSCLLIWESLHQIGLSGGWSLSLSKHLRTTNTVSYLYNTSTLPGLEQNTTKERVTKWSSCIKASLISGPRLQSGKQHFKTHSLTH